MKFKPGDKVRFLDEAGEGTVVSVADNGKIIVEDEDGFDSEYTADQLVSALSGDG